MLISGLTGGMAGIRVGTFAEACVTVSVVVVTLKRVAPESCDIDMPADKVFDTGVFIAVLVDVMAKILIDASVRTLNGDADANMWVPVWEFSTLPGSLVEVFLFCWTLFRCSPISTIFDCRALQAWIPSYHVC